MNKKLNNNFSLKKLLLTALVSGPLATLPAPLWALPVIDGNLTTSAGVTTQVVGSTLNVTSPDKAILTWQAFGSGGGTTPLQDNQIKSGDIINYFLPTASSSVLNTVTGGVESKIEGQILSNGNVYILNPAGIVISPTARINVGGFYASTVSEPSGFFAINGTLSYAGSSDKNVTVEGTGTTTAATNVTGDTATIQAVGAGNNIYLAGAAVDIAGGKFYGNVYVRSSSTTNPLGGVASTRIGTTGPVSVNLVGTPLAGGGLDVRTNGGNAILSGATGTLTIAPAVASTTGAVSINTSGTSINGTITQGAAAIIANTTGSVVTLNAGTGTTANSITLGTAGTPGTNSTNDFVTVGATGSNISIRDTNSIALNAITATGNVSVTSGGSITQGTGTHSVAGGVTLAPLATGAVSFTATGNVTLTALAASATTTLATSGDLTIVGNLKATNALSITSSGGQISAANISTTNTLTISAPSSLGNISSTGTIETGGVATITTAGNISATTLLKAAGATSAITATGGSITVGALTTSSTVNLSAPAGSITVNGAVTNSGNPLSLSAPTGTVQIGSVAGTNTLTVSAGTISMGAISTTSNATLTASTGTITTGAISTSSTLSLSAPAATGAIIANGALTSSTTQKVTLSSGGSIALNTTTVPVLSVTSTTGSITQTGIVTSTSSVTLAAPLGDITVTNAGNDFNTVVLTGGAGSAGIAVTDKNDIVIGSGTATLGATAIVAGAGIAAYTGGANVVIPNNIVNAAATATRNTSLQTITSIALDTAGAGGGAGYTSAPTVSITGGGGTGATATATLSTSGTGLVTGFTITNSGTGYTSTPSVGISGGQGTAPVASAVLTNGIVTGVNVTTAGTAPFASAPVITIEPAVVGGAGSGAIATAVLNSSNKLVLGTTSITPLQSGSITLGNNAIDTLSFGGTLSLSTTGIAGTNGVTNYSQISTAANNVRVFGNVTLNTNNTNASLGSSTFGNAANYSFGQINGNVGTGTLSVIEGQTLNLGTITAGVLDARSLNGDIINTGKLAVTGNTVLAANSIFSPGNVTLNFATNAISGNILIGNARDFSLTNNGNTTVTAGTSLVNGKAATGAVNVTVTGTGNTLNLSTASGGDYSTVGFNTAGPVTITDSNNGFTLQNATNTGTGTVNVSAAGPIVLGSGIALKSSGLTTISSTGATASITDSTAGIQIFGNVNMASDGQIAITQAGHSMGAVSLVTTGATNGTANATANITYTESGTANLNLVNVNTTNLATGGGALTVVSTAGSIIQTPASAGIQATAPVGTLSAGAVSAPAALTLAGSGYSSVTPPVVTIAAPPVGAGANVQATATAIVNVFGQVTGFNMTNAGTGYTSAPTFTIAAPTAGNAGGTIGGNIAGTASFTSVLGGVNLTNVAGTNNIGAVIAISAVGNSSIAEAQNITLGNTAVSAGTFSADSSSGSGKTITQAAGTTAKIFGASTFTTNRGAITLTNTDGTGNNFGAVTAKTNVGGALGADIAITEGGTLNFAEVKTGSNGKLTAISSYGDIIQTTAGGLTVGGATALTSSRNVALNLALTTNTFGGLNGIAITAPGNVSLQDAAGTTALAGGSTIGGTLTLKNTAGGGGGTIRDLPGTIAVAGNVWFDTGTTGVIAIGSSSITMGAVKFNSGTVNIVENATLNLAPGSVASGAVSLTSSGDIITSGAGGGSFQSTLTLNATGAITITNPILVVGVGGTTGLVFRALGAVNLGALSLSGNLNGIAPTSLGASTYTPPAP